MKKISVLFAFLLLAAVTFVGCKKDEEEKAAPTIAFSGTDAGNGSVEIDFAVTDPKSLVFNVNLAAEGEIATFTITKKIYASSTTTSQLTATGYDGKTSFTYNFDQSFASADFTGVTKIEFMFDVTDKQDPAKSVSKMFTVTKKTTSAGTPFATEFTTAKIYHILAPENASWDLVNDALISSSSPVADIYIQNNDAAGVVAGKFQSKNSCEFVKVSIDYSTATKEEAETAYTAGTSSTSVSSVAANDVFVAKKGSELYMIKITAISTTDGTSTAGNKGSMSFSYKK